MVSPLDVIIQHNAESYFPSATLSELHLTEPDVLQFVIPQDVGEFPPSHVGRSQSVRPCLRTRVSSASSAGQRASRYQRRLRATAEARRLARTEAEGTGEPLCSHRRTGGAMQSTPGGKQRAERPRTGVLQHRRSGGWRAPEALSRAGV